MRLTKQIYNVFITLLLMVIFFPGFLHAETNPVEKLEETKLLIPDNVEVKSLDGKEPKLTPSQGTAKISELNLSKGIHEIEIRYRERWKRAPDIQELVVSKFNIISFYAESGATYRVFFRKPSDYPDAKKLAKRIRFQIKKESGSRSAKPLPKAPVPVILAPTPLPAPSPIATEPVKDPMETGTDNLDVDSVQMLKFWWQRASSEDQDTFLEWLYQSRMD